MKCFEASGTEGGHRKCLLLSLLFRHKSQKGADDPWGQMSEFKFRSPGRWSSVLPDHLAPVRRELRLLEPGASALAAPKNQKKEILQNPSAQATFNLLKQTFCGISAF